MTALEQKIFDVWQESIKSERKEKNSATKPQQI